MKVTVGANAPGTFTVTIYISTENLSLVEKPAWNIGKAFLPIALSHKVNHRKLAWSFNSRIRWSWRMEVIVRDRPIILTPFIELKQDAVMAIRF
jgi:hypothetical protein